MMKRPKTRVAEAIAIRGYHAHMTWIHSYASNKIPWVKNSAQHARFLLGKIVDRPKVEEVY